MILVGLVIFLLFILSRLLAVDTSKSNVQINNLIGTNDSRADCVKETVYCVNDRDCSDVCSDWYVCGDSMTCEPSTLKAEKIQEKVDCNYNHGAFLSLAVDEFVGAYWTCIQTLSNLFDANDKQYPHVCAKGTFGVDTLKRQPVTGDCVCDSTRTRVLKNTDINTPRCATSQELKIYSGIIKDE